MKITKLGTEYLIEEKGTKKGKTLKIKAYVSKEGIDLYNQVGGMDFTFMESNPEMVQKIGKMIMKAGKLEI